MDELCAELLEFLITYLDQRSAVQFAKTSSIHRKLVLATTSVTPWITDGATAEKDARDACRLEATTSPGHQLHAIVPTLGGFAAVGRRWSPPEQYRVRSPTHDDHG